MPWIGSSPNQTTQRTDGTRTGSAVFADQKTALIKIRADLLDVHAQDIADMINECVKLDGGNINAQIPLNGNNFDEVSDATARDEFAAAGQIADGELIYAGTSAGTDTITASLSPAITAYVTGMLVAFKAGGTNTGAATLNINSVSATNLRKGPDAATALAAGDITTGGMYLVSYTGSVWHLLNPKTPVGYIVGTDIQAYDELLAEIAALSTDPNADSGLFFDDSAGNVAYWTPTGALSFSGTNLVVATAADANVGVIEIATQAEMETGTDTGRAVVPGRQHFHPGHPKAGGKFDGTGTPAFAAGDYGMGAITDNGTGDYTLALDTAFANANYWQTGFARDDSTANSYMSATASGTKTTTAFQVQVRDSNNTNQDTPEGGISFWGDYA